MSEEVAVQQWTEFQVLRAGIFFMGSKVGCCWKIVWLGQRKDGSKWVLGGGSLMGSEGCDHYLDSQLAPRRAAQTKESHFPWAADSKLAGLLRSFG